MELVSKQEQIESAVQQLDLAKANINVGKLEDADLEIELAKALLTGEWVK